MNKKKLHGRTSIRNTYSTAKAMVCFQTRPGVGRSKLISTAGPATLHLMSQAPKQINPDKEGCYALSLEAGDSGFFELFGVKFNVAWQESNGMQTAPNPAIVYWHAPLFPIETLEGIQQRLQILGYYTGIVDGIMGALTERAVLEFQADEGTLLIDGDPGPMTKSALNAYFNLHGFRNKTILLIRKYMLLFKRAKTGPAVWDCPHPDYRGGTPTMVSFGLEQPEQGIVSQLLNSLGVSSSFPARFSFKVGMECALPGCSLPSIFPKIGISSGSGHVIDCLTTGPKTVPNSFVFIVKEVGNAYVGFHCGKSNGPEIAELEIIIVPLLQVHIAAHILHITDSLAGIQGRNNWNEGNVKDFLADLNGIWLPIGIEFKLESLKTHKVMGKYADRITNEIYDATKRYKTAEYYQLWQKYNTKKRINMYFADLLLDEYVDVAGNVLYQSTNTLGYALSRKKSGPNGFTGVCIQYNTNTKEVAQTVAHELGHMLSLTTAPAAHSDDDGTDIPWRHDIWSRTRLMAKYARYDVANPNRTWHSTGYGMQGTLMDAGAFITIKKLRKDGSDGELSVSRKAAENPY